MNRGMFTADVTETTVSTAVDIFEFACSAGVPVAIYGWHLYQVTELGDAAEEILEVETVRGVGSVTSGSGGGTSTPQPINDLEGGSGTPTVENMNTTRMAAGSGSLEELEKYGWNVRVPWTHLYLPELRPIIRDTNRWTLSIDTAPGDALDIGATIWFQLLG